MALFGSLETIRRQAADLSRFAAAGEYLAEVLRPESEAHRRLHAQAVGETKRIDLPGGAFALEQAYRTKERGEGFFESHQRYIDVQVMVAGEELMEVADIKRLQAQDTYNGERDFTRYRDYAVASVWRMQAGDVAIFYPVDGHMPGLRAGNSPVVVRKTVVKIPVPAA